ncbi:MAG: hypothetical protein WDZ27_05370 [Waddliaceae bacterium]
MKNTTIDFIKYPIIERQNGNLLKVRDWRNSFDSIQGKVLGRSVTLLVYATVGVISVAEGVISLALAILTTPTLLLSQDKQLSKWLFIRSAGATLYGIYYVVIGIIQTGLDNLGSSKPQTPENISK